MSSTKLLTISPCLFYFLLQNNARYLSNMPAQQLSISNRIHILNIRNPKSVVNQPYGADILMEYVIKGNSAVLKCSIPSFVADFVRVEAWIDEEGTELVPSDNYG